MADHPQTVAEAASSLLAPAMKSAPPLAVVGTGWSGLISWSDLAYVLTVLWVVLQIAGFLWDRFYLRREEVRQLWRSMSGGGNDV